MKNSKSINDIISKIDEKFSLNLPGNNYDALLCKSLSATDLGKNPKSHQAHIAISNQEMMDIFPKIIIDNYKPTTADDAPHAAAKSFYYLEIPITLYKQNFRYLEKINPNNTPIDDITDSEFQDKATISPNMSIVLNRRKGSNPQIELSDECKTLIRKVADTKDILVIAKVKQKLLYDAFIIGHSDPEADFFSDTAIFEFSQKNKTAVNIRNYHQAKDSESYNHSGKNVIYYGAPGTGKSHQLNKQLSKTKFRRVTFYPDYNYTDFIGGMKPKRINGHIDYPYVGGILADTVAEAIDNPTEEVVLLVEEINRANAASVFGDTFQLLDRNSDGTSTYSIRNTDLGHYIDKNTNTPTTFEEDGVSFPSNFSIMATMNPADQGVYPLDTAFTRRWQMTYFPINWTDESVSDANVAGFDYPWNILGPAINHLLYKNGIEEDEMLGQYFMTTNELQNIKLVASKLLGYLWNNVLRYKRQIVFNAETLSDLMNQFEYQEKGLKIFHEESQEVLKRTIADLQKQSIETSNEDNHEHD